MSINGPTNHRLMREVGLTRGARRAGGKAGSKHGFGKSGRAAPQKRGIEAAWDRFVADDFQIPHKAPQPRKVIQSPGRFRGPARAGLRAGGWRI